MSAEELVTPAPAPQNWRALSTAREGYISPRNRTSRQFRLQFAPSRAAGSSGSGEADARTRIAKPNWLRAQAGVPCCEKCRIASAKIHEAMYPTGDATNGDLRASGRSFYSGVGGFLAKDVKGFSHG